MLHATPVIISCNKHSLVMRRVNMFLLSNPSQKIVLKQANHPLVEMKKLGLEGNYWAL